MKTHSWLWQSGGIVAALFVGVILTACNLRPTAEIIASVTDGEAPLTVTFDANAATPRGQITSLHWDFGDGSTSDEERPIHTFVAPETYTVTVTVTNSRNRSTTVETVVIVRKPDETDDPGEEEAVASLRATLSPQTAVSVGAQWRIEGQKHWRDSNAPIKPVPLGDYTIEFRPMPGWKTPAAARITVDAHVPFSVRATYTTTAPEAPTNVAAASGPEDVLVQWEEQTLYTVAGYHVYRTEDGAKNAARLTDEPIRALRYEDKYALSGAVYDYSVTAVTHDGTESEPSAPARVAAGQIVLDLPLVSGLPWTVVRMPIATRNAFGISSESLQMDIEFYDCETEERVDVFSPDSLNALTTAITADSFAAATWLDTGLVRIEATGANGRVFTGEGRLLELVGTVNNLPENEVFCARIVDAALWWNNVRLDYAATAGALVTTSECMRGDVNNNTVVEDVDANLVLDIAARHEEADACREQAGDLNMDNRLNSADATIILRLLAGWYDNPATDGTPTLADILRPHGTEQPPEPVLMAVGDGTTDADGIVDVPVQVSMPEGFYGVEATVAWPDDPELLTPLDFNIAPEFGAAAALIDRAVPGVARILLSRATATPAPEDMMTLAWLQFQVAPNAPQGYTPPVTLQGVRLYGAYGESADWYAPVDWEDGKIAPPVEEPVECVAYFWVSSHGGLDVLFFADYDIDLVRDEISWIYWEFGDGRTSLNEWEPVHTYAAPGEYQACMTIETVMGCTDRWCQTVWVSAYEGEGY